MSDNRFPMILGAATVIVVGGLVYLGVSEGMKYADYKKSYDKAVSEIRKLTSGPIYPSSANRQAKEKAVDDYAMSVAELQQEFDSYRRPELKKVGVSEFTDALLKNRTQVFNVFEENGCGVPSEFFLGLRRYTEEPVKKSYAPLLAYQLEAFTELFGQLAAAKPAELVNVHRPILPEEQGGPSNLEGKAFRQHPIEITFIASEKSLREFLSALDDSENFYYVVRTLRVRNERLTAPNAGDALFEKPRAPVEVTGGAGTPFEDFFSDIPEKEPVAPGEFELPVPVKPERPAGPADTSEILKQVLGAENLEVFLRIDVLQFLAPEPLPTR